MITLSKRLNEKSQEVLTRFVNQHPIHAAIGQPLSPETKRIMHRFYRVAEEFRPQCYRFSVMALEIARTDDEKEVFSAFIDNFSIESIENQFAQHCRPFFGDISAEVRAEKTCEALAKMKAVSDRVLATKDSLHCLVMLYGATQVSDCFWNSANVPFAETFADYQVHKMDDELNAIRNAIDNNPKSKTIDEGTFKDYVNSYMEFLILEINAFDYFYNQS